MKGNMIMFAKRSLKSFVYDMIDVFCFPNDEIKEIYDFYQIEKCFLYQNFTDTDSTSLFFNFICNIDCSVPESEVRKIIFQCLKKSKIAQRLDVSDNFWKEFEMSNSNTKKQMGFYEAENVDNPNICTVAMTSINKVKFASLNDKRY